MKYWKRYTDGAFENILLLYSRKYGTNHYAIFHAVKVGRVRNWKDEELLHAVLANVAQGYYYSISGDLYLQRAWKQLKLNLEPSAPPSQAKGLPVPAVKKAKVAKRSKKQTEKAAVQETNKAEKETASTRKKKETKKNVQVNSVSVSGAAMPSAKKVLQKNTATAPESRKSTKPVSAASVPESRKTAQEQIVAEKTSASVQIYPINEPKGLPASIAETVKKVTGKSYGIYRDLFFKEVRSAIRTILQHSTVQKLSFFGSEQNNAENIIYQFLETNYDNPYQQWQGSKEQADVFEQGFRIDTLEPIIRLWAQNTL
jgi:uncharacterized protein TP_0793